MRVNGEYLSNLRLADDIALLSNSGANCNACSLTWRGKAEGWV
ncbi:MAG TPA: hypothetical protein ACHBX0_09335 [Arsenophonus sp.]